MKENHKESLVLDYNLDYNTFKLHYFAFKYGSTP